MSFESFAHVPVTEELLRHVWDGEIDLGKGGHRFGLGREGKTEFPVDWDISRIEMAITEVLRQPQYLARNGNDILLGKQVGDVMVMVKLKKTSTQISAVTAFPDSGRGVIRNERGLRHPIPLNNFGRKA
ncbi:MAG: hypothetical protein RLZZ52_969 [Actinomycetota bacterium]